MAEVTPEDVFGPDKLQALMDQRPGLTMGALLDRLVEKLGAKETKVFRGKGLVEGEDGKLVEESILIYSVPLDAHHIQLQALDMALRLRRAYPDPKLTLDTPGEFRFVIVPPDGNDDAQSKG